MKRKKLFETEAGLGRGVSEWLSAWGWDVFPEVVYGPGRADIVATQGRLIWVIETKLTLSLALIEQAWKWTGRAHFVSVAVPLGPKYRGRHVAERFCKLHGIGIIEAGVLENVDPDFPETIRGPRLLYHISRSWKQLPPKLDRKASTRIREALTDKQKKFIPGNADCSFYTPFRDTCEQLRETVLESPGLTVKAAVDKIRHHYRSDTTARSCLMKWVDWEKVPGVRLDRSKKPARFFPAEMSLLEGAKT